MEKELEMRILPSFCEEKCAIIFSVHFKLEKQKIGEAIIYTCSEGYQPEDLSPSKNSKFNLKQKIAYIREFEVIEEYKAKSLKHVLEFLKVIGIQNYMFKKENTEHQLELSV
ncbi:hypothetical protein [Cytobacillus sp. NCCP-133]|uniref:hypothetical protein n=1 Tax=Cytobacillus sp. NCCP-133 TaxID=766848 RepID=UPI00222FBD73|nr:hypothetical protein [Cytobacillus sp. NCCP-133]GLB60213.1 hypothetical protein NCCP133_23450 [Cytobacillus sp. NCCP-133]